MASEKFSTKSSRVLVAEDDLVTQVIIKRSLATVGFPKENIIIVNDGAAAWESLKEGNLFDIVITDENMPKMNGHELIENLTAKKFSGLIIGMSATEAGKKNSGTGAEEAMMKAGATAFYNKATFITPAGLGAALKELDVGDIAEARGKAKKSGKKQRLDSERKPQSKASHVGALKEAKIVEKSTCGEGVGF